MKGAVTRTSPVLVHLAMSDPVVSDAAILNRQVEGLEKELDRVRQRLWDAQNALSEVIYENTSLRDRHDVMVEMVTELLNRDNRNSPETARSVADRMLASARLAVDEASERERSRSRSPTGRSRLAVNEASQRERSRSRSPK